MEGVGVPFVSFDGQPEKLPWRWLESRISWLWDRPSGGGVLFLLVGLGRDRVHEMYSCVIEIRRDFGRTGWYCFGVGRVYGYPVQAGWMVCCYRFWV